MTIKLNTLLLVLGGLLFGVGLILGLTPMTQGGSNCGSAFVPSSGFWLSGQCSDALSSRRGISLALAIPGALFLIGGGMVTMGGKAEDVEAGATLTD